MTTRKTHNRNSYPGKNTGKQEGSPLSKADRLHQKQDEGFENPADEVSKALKKKNEELKTIDKEFISFSYVSSNDLQEPLRKIQTFTSRILEKEINNLSENGKEYFTRMQKAANRMQRIIDDLVTFSQLTASKGVFEPMRVNDVLAEVISELRPQILLTHAKIEYGELGSINIIKYQFMQLLQNLLSNALKFSRESETLRIRISSQIAKGSRFHNNLLEPNRKYYNLCIEDNGIGFEARFCDRIFEVFQRLHGQEEFEGTGIGLAICKKIVENHRGVICANGELEKGATFNIYLPVR